MSDSTQPEGAGHSILDSKDSRSHANAIEAAHLQEKLEKEAEEAPTLRPTEIAASVGLVPCSRCAIKS